MHTCDALCEVAHGGAVRVYDGQHGGRVVDDDRGVVGECDVHLAIGKDNQAHQTRRKRHGCPSGAWFGGKGFNSGLFTWCSPFVTYKKVACSLPLYFLAGAYRARAMPVHLGASHSPRACD